MLREIVRESGVEGAQVDLDETECHVRGDAVLLHEAITNLVQNASIHGEAKVELSLRSEEGSVLIVVQNHGPAIPMDQAEQLFEPFRQMNERTSDVRGHGLGLSIVRAIAEPTEEASLLGPCRWEASS